MWTRRQFLNRQVHVTPQVREPLRGRLAQVVQFLLRREAIEIVPGGEAVETHVEIFSGERHDAVIGARPVPIEFWRKNAQAEG